MNKNREILKNHLENYEIVVFIKNLKNIRILQNFALSAELGISYKGMKKKLINMNYRPRKL